MAPQRKRVQANGAEFVVTDQGDKDATPVLLLHGFPTSASIWNKQVCLIARSSNAVEDYVAVLLNPL